VSSHSPDPHAVRPISDRSAPAQPAGPRGPGSAASDAAVRPGIEQLREIAARSLDALRRRKKVFWAMFLGVAALLAAAIALQTPLYESTSLMLIKFGRELVYTPQIGADRSFVAQDKEAVINSELAILRSQPVLEGVVRDVGVATLYPGLAESAGGGPAAGDGGRAGGGNGPDPGGGPASGTGGDPGRDARSSPAAVADPMVVAEAAERLRLSLSTQALPEADVIQVSFQHSDPLVAARTVDAVVDRFLDAHVRAFSEPELVRFLEGRVQSYEERLAGSEKTLREFQTEHPAFALDDPQAVLVQQRDELRTALSDVENQMATIRLRHLQEDASVAEARNTLLALEVEASRLEGRLLEETRGQITVVKRFIAQRKAEIQSELAALDARRTEIEASLAETRAEMARMPTLSAEYRRLLRERDGDEEQYRTYSKRLRDARLSSEMDQERIASVNVIQPASLSPRPVWPPSKGTSIAFAVVLALVAAVLGVTLLDRIGPTGIAWLDGTDVADGEAPERREATG